MSLGGAPRRATAAHNGNADAEGEDDGAVTVMSFNLWYGGQEHPGHKTIRDVAAVILRSGCHVAGLQELRGRPDPQTGKQTSVMPALVAALNGTQDGTDATDCRIDGIVSSNGDGSGDATTWIGIEKDEYWGIVSRLPMVAESGEKFGAKFQAPGGGGFRGGASGKSFWLFDVHLPHFPYEPYEAVGIPYCGSDHRLNTAEEAVESARKTRSSKLGALLADVERSCHPDEAVAITGDFNEPSCLDWIEKVLFAGSIPFACEWPVSKTLLDAGFVDTYRRCYPSPTSHPGYTWTPREPIPEVEAGEMKRRTKSEQHDRIDFVYARGFGQVLSCQIAGCSQFLSPDLALASRIDDWPTDHQVVIAKLQL